MQATIELPKAFSVRDDRELPLIQDLMARLNPKLLVAQVATGVHVDGGYTVNWGLVYLDGQPLTDEDVAAALKEAGLDAQHNAEIQPSRIWVNNEPGGDRNTARVIVPVRGIEPRGKASIVFELAPTAGMVPAAEEARPTFEKGYYDESLSSICSDCRTGRVHHRLRKPRRARPRTRPKRRQRRPRTAR